MLKGVGAHGVDPTQQGWSKALKRDQVSQLIEVLKGGILPTGESDIPAMLRSSSGRRMRGPTSSSSRRRSRERGPEVQRPRRRRRGQSLPRDSTTP
jgi:hypothetical protein